MRVAQSLSRFIVVLVMLSVGCIEDARAASLCQPQAFPQLTFDKSHVFPPERGLARPEDGAALPDGRIVVADERYGLLVIDQNGSSRPFGQFKKAGYSHRPPDFPGGPNGVYLEHDARHLLMGDIYTGKIYRVEIDTEETRLIYDHRYGVNSLYRDRRGTIWFTQSTKNSEQRGKEDLWAAVSLPMATGAILKLPGSGDQIAEKAEEVVGSLYLANGITLDRTESYMYVSESNMDRVLRFRVDVVNGSLSDREVYQNVYIPDNLAIDADNNLWIASPVWSKVIVIDHQCHTVHTVFRAESKSHTAFLDEWIKRSYFVQPRNQLLTPEAYNPLPHFLTGLFFSPNHDIIYFTGLGNAILKYTVPKK